MTKFKELTVVSFDRFCDYEKYDNFENEGFIYDDFIMGA